MDDHFGTRTKTDGFVQPYTDFGHVDRAAVVERYPKTPEEMPLPWISSSAEFNKAWMTRVANKGVPEAKLHEMMVQAQVSAFRDTMEFTRRHGWKVDFPKNVALFEMFKAAERDTLDALVAKYLVEHGCG